MLEEVKRKEVDKRDKQLPQSFEQLIQMYDLDRIWTYLQEIVNFANNDLPEDLEEKTQKNIITMALDSNVTNPEVETYTKIPLSSRTNIGNKLSVSNNGVLIGSGVHHIKVSAKMEFDAGSNTSSRYIRIINGDTISGSSTITWCVKESRSNVASYLAIPEVVCPVNQGDTINLFYFLRSGDKISGFSDIIRTYLTVEVVD